MPKKIHKQKPELPFPCTSCKREFMTLEGVTNIKDEKHSRKRPYKYQSCDKTFLTTANLILYYNSHWRETVRMYFLWQEIFSNWSSKRTLEISHWRKTSSVKNVAWVLFALVQIMQRYTKTTKHLLYEKNYEESGTSEPSSDSQWHKAT